MTCEIETKNATRHGRKVTSWRMMDRGEHRCGHVATIETAWHFEQRDAKLGDATGSAAAKLIAGFAQPCEDCRWVALGGPIMPGMFDR